MVLRNWKRALASMMVAGVLVACGGATNDTDVGVFKGAPEGPAGGSSGGGASSGNALVVDTAAGGDLKFAETSLNATTGEVKVTFNNKGAVEHNWVLVKPGDEQKIVDASATNSPTFLPTEGSIAHTKTIKGGESDNITFQIAEAGTYSYICTFPGHFAAGMKGTLEVAQGSGAPTTGGETGGEASAPPATGGGTATIDSADAATLKFSQDAYDLPSGNVAITFNNKGAVQHNAVIVKQGDEDKIVNAAVANPPDFLPKEGSVAHSKTINGGQSDTFNATLEPGTYTLVCTFPGHYAGGMKATVTVK